MSNVAAGFEIAARPRGAHQFPGWNAPHVDARTLPQDLDAWSHGPRMALGALPLGAFPGATRTVHHPAGILDAHELGSGPLTVMSPEFWVEDKHKSDAQQVIAAAEQVIADASQEGSQTEQQTPPDYRPLWREALWRDEHELRWPLLDSYASLIRRWHDSTLAPHREIALSHLPSDDAFVWRLADLLAAWSSDADRYEAVVTRLGRNGLATAAERLRHLRDVTDTKTGESPIHLDSLRHLAAFLMSQRHLSAPGIFITPDGLAQIEWRTSEGGIVALEFLKDGWIQFAGISARILEGDDRESVSGVYQTDATLLALSPFLSKISSE